MTDEQIWTEGVCGAAILRDGVMVRIEDVLAALNQGQRLNTHVAALRSMLEAVRDDGTFNHRPITLMAVRDVLRGRDGDDRIV